MVTRVLKVQITGLILPPATEALASPGTYVVTEVRQPPSASMTGAIALLAEPASAWRFRKLDAQGEAMRETPGFVLSFREMAEHIEARRMRIVEGDFV